MTPLKFAILLFAVIYPVSLVLYNMALGPAPAQAGAVWYIWRAVGMGCLSASAVEFVMFIMWMWQKLVGAPADGGVPLMLSEDDRNELRRLRPTLALLMPAHNEASTPDDREALAGRIFDTLMKTPEYSTFFLLADSPATQRENELSVIHDVQNRLRAAGRPEQTGRLVLEEYRDKPADWRHKCGSILCWLERYADKYEFMFMLDADSTLPAEDPDLPQTCDVVERMVLAALRDENLALIQAAIEVGSYHTPWGWLQASNTRLGEAYYLKVFSYLYDRASPCYGHNCLFRVRDFAEHAHNTMTYTSHDHVDSNDLAAAGHGCVLSDAVVTCEETEESFPLWFKRECRWSRGNGQWIVYLLKKRSLSLGGAVYLLLGIAQYVWTLLATIFFIAAVVLMHNHCPLVANPDGLPARLLIGMIVGTLVVPKMLASTSVIEFAAGLAASMLLGPALMMYQGIAFVLGAFGSKWIPRGARSGSFGIEHMAGVFGTFVPAMLVGLVLWALVAQDLEWGVGSVLVYGMIIATIASPLTALLLSWPLRSSAGGEVEAVPQAR